MQCFGKYTNCPKCRQCEYLTACQIDQQTEHRGNRLGFSSTEMVEPLLIADNKNIPYGAEWDMEDQKEIKTMFAEFAKFLLSLDEYSLAVIGEVVKYDEFEEHERCSVSVLAKKFGVSRWAMHKKILRMIVDDPKLFELFNPVLYKLSNARKRALRNNAKNQNDNKSSYSY